MDTLLMSSLPAELGLLFTVCDIYIGRFYRIRIRFLGSGAVRQIYIEVTVKKLFLWVFLLCLVVCALCDYLVFCVFCLTSPDL